MSFHALSWFRIKMMKPACVTGEEVVNKVVAFDSMSFHQVRGNVYFAEFFAAPSARKKNPHRLREHSVPYSSLCCRNSDMCRFSLMSSTVVDFFSLGKGSSLADSMGLTGEAFIPSLKYFAQLLTMTESAYSYPYSHRNSAVFKP